MEEAIVRFFENIVGRASGPMHIRLLLQPTMSLIFAARAGFRDARAGEPPYLQTLFGSPADRGRLVRELFKDEGKVFLIAVALDVVYQLVTIQWVYPGETLAVAFVLAFVPYLIFRGIFTRLAYAFGRNVPPPKRRNYA